MMQHGLLLVALSLLASAARAAESQEDISDLENLLDSSVVKTASQSAEVAETAPATTSVITADELRRFGIRSLDQALNFLSLGIVTENPLSSVEVGARGVLLNADYGSHMLLLINGHVANEPWNGTAYFDRTAALPLDLVDHIEVVLGPGSVLYGSNAMLGVINVVTKRAKDYQDMHVLAESEIPVLMRGGLGFGRQFELLGTEGEVTAAVEYYGQSGPRHTYGPQFTGDDAVTGAPKQWTANGLADGIWGGEADDTLFARIPSGYLQMRWGELELDLRAAQSTRGTPFNSGANFDDPNSSERDRWLSLDLRYSRPLSTRVTLSARGYGDLYDYRQLLTCSAPEDCAESQLGGCEWKLGGMSRWTGLELQSHIDWLADGRIVTLMGGDGRIRKVGSRAVYTDAVTGGEVEPNEYHHVEHAEAAYLEQTFRPSKRIAFNAGARLDHDQSFGTHLSPRAAATMEPWQRGFWRVIYAEAFRAPSAYERFFSDPTGFVASPDLAPEVVRSVESSVEQWFGTQRVLVGVFRAWWTNRVVQSSLTEDELAAAIENGKLEAVVEDALRYRNAASLTNYGLNASYQGTALARRLRYGLTFTWAHAREDLGDGSGETELRVAGPYFGNAHVSYDLGEELPTLALAARYVPPRLVDYSEFEPTPKSPRQVELRATISGPVSWVKGLDYRLTANYSTADRAPYSVGPLSGPQPDYTEQEMVPVDRFRMMLGLAYQAPL